MKSIFKALALSLLASCKCNTSSHQEATFINGMNIPWVDFGRDVGTGQPPLDVLREQFYRLAHIARKGPVLVRLWIHTDGRFSPEFDPVDGRVIGPRKDLPQDLRAILDVASQENVQVLPVLWSHDLLRSNEEGSRDFLNRNRQLLTDEKVLQSYIENALQPMVEKVDRHPALYGWEIINEPEGLTVDEGWSIIDPKDRLTLDQVRVFVGRQAAAIRRMSQGPVRITVGSVSARYLNTYNDSDLKRAAKDSMAYLDFYQIHYYSHMDPELNPFAKSAVDFRADKPILVGEFYPHQWSGLGLKVRRHLYSTLRDYGYMGALAWKDGHYPEMGPILEAIGYSQDLAGIGVQE